MSVPRGIYSLRSSPKNTNGDSAYDRATNRATYMTGIQLWQHRQVRVDVNIIVLRSDLASCSKVSANALVVVIEIGLSKLGLFLLVRLPCDDFFLCDATAVSVEKLKNSN